MISQSLAPPQHRRKTSLQRFQMHCTFEHMAAFIWQQDLVHNLAPASMVPFQKLIAVSNSLRFVLVRRFTASLQAKNAPSHTRTPSRSFCSSTSEQQLTSCQEETQYSGSLERTSAPFYLFRTAETMITKKWLSLHRGTSILPAVLKQTVCTGGLRTGETTFSTAYRQQADSVITSSRSTFLGLWTKSTNTSWSNLEKTELPAVHIEWVHLLYSLCDPEQWCVLQRLVQDAQTSKQILQALQDWRAPAASSYPVQQTSQAFCINQCRCTDHGWELWSGTFHMTVRHPLEQAFQNSCWSIAWDHFSVDSTSNRALFCCRDQKPSACFDRTTMRPCTLLYHKQGVMAFNSRGKVVFSKTCSTLLLPCINIGWSARTPGQPARFLH